MQKCPRMWAIAEPFAGPLFYFGSWICVSVRYFLWWLAYICSSSNVLSLSKTWRTVETYSWRICLCVKVMYSNTGSRNYENICIWLDTLDKAEFGQQVCRLMAITVVRLTGTQKQITRQSQSLTALLFLKHNKLFCGHFVPSVVLRCNTAVFHEMPGILRVVMSGGGGGGGGGGDIWRNDILSSLLIFSRRWLWHVAPGVVDALKQMLVWSNVNLWTLADFRCCS